MKKDYYYNISLVILSIAIIVVVYVKYIEKKENKYIKKKELSKIEITDFADNRFLLSSVLRKNEETYILILEIDNCGSCITKGINELNSLRDQGKYCLSIIVYDRPNEISGWAENYNFSPFYIVDKSTYYKYFRFQYLPLIFTLKNGKLKILRYITM